MILGGHGEADRVNLFRLERFEIADDTRFEFGGDLRGAFGVGVHDADQFHAFHFAPHTDVVAAEVSDADYRNAYGFFGHDFLVAADFLRREN